MHNKMRVDLPEQIYALATNPQETRSSSMVAIFKMMPFNSSLSHWRYKIHSSGSYFDVIQVHELWPTLLLVLRGSET